MVLQVNGDITLTSHHKEVKSFSILTFYCSFVSEKVLPNVLHEETQLTLHLTFDGLDKYPAIYLWKFKLVTGYLL